MSYIKTFSYEEADSELRAAYDQIVGSRGKLAAVHQIQSLNPPALLAHMDLYKAVMFGKSPLKRYQREMMAVRVSVANRCPYCIEHHKEALLFYWKDADRVERLLEAPTTAELDQADLSLCSLATRLTETPGSHTEADIVALRNNGFSDRAILDAVQVIAYFNFVNRMVLALGVEFTEEEKTGYEY